MCCVKGGSQISPEFLGFLGVCMAQVIVHHPSIIILMLKRIEEQTWSVQSIPYVHSHSLLSMGKGFIQPPPQGQKPLPFLVVRNDGEKVPCKRPIVKPVAEGNLRCTICDKGKTRTQYYVADTDELAQNLIVQGCRAQPSPCLGKAKHA